MSNDLRYKSMKRILLLLLIFSSYLNAQTVTVNISGLRNKEGSVRLQVFNSSKSFDDSKPMLIKTFSKAASNGGMMKMDVNGLKPGVYGIAILDDENGNEKMDYGFILPKEGFGFSDYYHTGMSRPVFTQFDFILGNEPKTVQIRLRYL